MPHQLNLSAMARPDPACFENRDRHEAGINKYVCLFVCLEMGPPPTTATALFQAASRPMGAQFPAGRCYMYRVALFVPSTSERRELVTVPVGFYGRSPVHAACTVDRTEGSIHKNKQLPTLTHQHHWYKRYSHGGARARLPRHGIIINWLQPISKKPVTTSSLLVKSTTT